MPFYVCHSYKCWSTTRPGCRRRTPAVMPNTLPVSRRWLSTTGRYCSRSLLNARAICRPPWISTGSSMPYVTYSSRAPRAGSGVERTDPLRFLAGWRNSWLNQEVAVHSLSLDFLACLLSIVLLTMAPFCVVFCVISVFCLLIVLARLSVPVQVIDWKDSSPKGPIRCWWGC